VLSYQEETMKKQAITEAIGWGAWLILAGIATVLVRIAEPSAGTWFAILAGGTVSALAVYLTGPAREGTSANLFDLALVAGFGVLLELALLAIGLGATYVFGLLALPLLVSGLRRRGYRWLLILAVASGALAILIPLANTGRLGTDAIAAYFFAAAALPFVIAWLTGRAGSWVLWIAYALVAMAPLFPLTAGDWRLGHYLGTYLLAAAALPLLLTSLVRRHWGWPLLAGYGLLAAAILLPLVAEGVIPAHYTAAYVLLVTALGTLIAAARQRQARWMLAPAAMIAIAGTALVLRQNAVTALGASILVITGVGVTLRQLIRAGGTRRPARPRRS
jgi:hypothetical protein